MVLVLVGNKIDLEKQRKVSTEEAKKFAQTNGLLFVETSAKTGLNVYTCFSSAAHAVWMNFENKLYDISDEIGTLKKKEEENNGKHNSEEEFDNDE